MEMQNHLGNRYHSKYNQKRLNRFFLNPIDHKNNKFKSFNDMCGYYEQDTRKVISRILRGFSLQEALTFERQSIKMNPILDTEKIEKKMLEEMENNIFLKYYSNHTDTNEINLLYRDLFVTKTSIKEREHINNMFCRYKEWLDILGGNNGRE